MNLIELDPRWIRNSDERLGMGISFDCPHCPVGGKARITLWFENPVDELSKYEDAGSYWLRFGKNLKTITLSPFISIPEHWDGLIEEGKIITAKLLNA